MLPRKWDRARVNFIRMDSVPVLSIQIGYWAEAPHLSLLWEPVLHLTLS